MTVCRPRYAMMTALMVLGFAATPLAAQTATVPDPPPPPSSNGVVGPRELQDFSLPGAVVRPAEPVNAAPPRPRPAPTTNAPLADQPAQATRDEAPPADAAPTRRRESPATTATPPPAAEIAPPPAETAPLAVSPTDVIAASPTIAPLPTGGAPLWPWLLALLAAAGAAGLVYFRRQRGSEELAFAGAGINETVPAAPRAPMPRGAQPQPQPRAPVPVLPPAPVPPPVPGGIVSTALKPELELIFTPLSVAIDDAGTAMVVFDLIVHNHGGAPARDVLVEAGMFNAGPNQDRLIGDFFASPRAEGDRIPLIAPMGKIGVRSRVSIPAERIDELEMAGRKLLIPMVAFNTMFRWAGGETQRSASFLVGRGNNDEAKLAPFALDRGSRAWGDVAARSHSMGLAS